jgi:hypothetical protein
VSREAARICACHGPWQAIVLSAALETRRAEGGDSPPRTVLALSGERLSAPIRRAMEACVALLRGFDDVVWIDDLAAGVTGLGDHEFQGRLAELRERLGVGEAAEVWTGNPRTPADRVLFDVYPDAPIVVFEDGLGTYAAPWSEEASAAGRALETAKALTKALVRPGVSVRGAAFAKGVRLVGQRPRRPEAAYLVLAEWLGVPAPYGGAARVVGRDTLATAVERVRAGRPRPAIDGPKPRALVLGGSYSFWSAMSRDDEATLHAAAIERLGVAGYEVWWKEHPRTLEPLLPELRRRLAGAALHAFDAPSALPLEVQLDEDAFDLVVSATSTSLLYLPLLFGDRVRVATVADTVGPHLGGVRHRIAELVLGVVPRLDAVLASAPGGVGTREAAAGS